MFKFKLVNNYPLEALLKRVKLNFKIMLTAYLLTGVVLVSIFITYFSEELKHEQLELLIFPAILLVFLLSLLSILSFRWNYIKNDKYSLFSEYNVNAISDFDSMLSHSDQITGRIFVGRGYVFVLISSFYIPHVIPINDIVYIWENVNKPYLLIQVRDSSRKYKIPFGIKIDYRAVKKLFFDKLKEYSPNLQPLDKWRDS